MSGLFGDLFDFNRDGKTSFEEELLGMSMMMAALEDDDKAGEVNAGFDFGDDMDSEDEE